jgi:hypothetical protein
MGAKCCSRSRCRRISCDACARRYAGRITRRILTATSDKHYAITIELPSSSLADFWAWRVEARNLIDYRRRTCRWWREVALHVWFCQGGSVRGVVSLGSVTCAEALAAFNCRWPTILRLVDLAELRQEIAAIVRPGIIAPAHVSARYQGLKLSIRPQHSKLRIISFSTPMDVRQVVEPMPFLISNERNS